MPTCFFFFFLFNNQGEAVSHRSCACSWGPGTRAPVDDRAVTKADRKASMVDKDAEKLGDEGFFFHVDSDPFKL